MTEIKIHGLGGQGVVTMAKIIAISAFKNKLFAQAFPSFGPERVGAPVEAFVRVDNKEIRLREQVYEPDFLIIIEEKLIANEEIKKGITRKTKIIINSKKSTKELQKILKSKNIYSLDCREIAEKLLNKKLINTALLGFFAKKSKIFDLKTLQEILKDYFKEKGEEVVKKNLKAADIAYKN